MHFHIHVVSPSFECAVALPCTNHHVFSAFFSVGKPLVSTGFHSKVMRWRSTYNALMLANASALRWEQTFHCFQQPGGDCATAPWCDPKMSARIHWRIHWGAGFWWFLAFLMKTIWFTHAAEHLVTSDWEMGLSENSVPLHPMVNDHYPY